MRCCTLVVVLVVLALVVRVCLGLGLDVAWRCQQWGLVQAVALAVAMALVVALDLLGRRGACVNRPERNRRHRHQGHLSVWMR